MVHGDLKPDNVLLTKHFVVYVSDLKCPIRLPRVLRTPRAADAALLLQRWVRRDLSNFDYLMALNRLAGG